jgi:hypothetical protein
MAALSPAHVVLRGKRDTNNLCLSRTAFSSWPTLITNPQNYTYSLTAVTPDSVKQIGVHKHLCCQTCNEIVEWGFGGAGLFHATRCTR